MRRLGGMVALVVGWLVIVAAPAAAELTTNEVGCAGSAVITGDDGSTVSVDAEDAEATVPNSGTAAYEGSVATVTHDHSGRIDLAVGPIDIAVGSWGPSENADDESSDSGTKELPSALGGIPPGRYELSGSHRGDEGGCAGRMTVEIEGDVTHPAVLASLGLTALSGVGLLAALRAVPAKSGGRP